MVHVTTRMDLENNMLSETSLSPKITLFCDFIYMQCSEEATPYRRETGSWLPRAGEGEGRV